MPKLHVLPVFVAVLLMLGGNPAASEEIEIGGTGAALGTMRILLGAYAASHPGFSGNVLPSLGSAGGIKAVLQDAIDLAVTSRPLKEETTALVPVVSIDNPTTGVTTRQIIAIYRGELEHWANGTAVRMVLRPNNESDTKLLNNYIPDIMGAQDNLRKNAAIPVAISDQDNADTIQQIPGGFGFSTLSLVYSEQRPLRTLSLDGINPDVATIASGSYPMTKPFYFVTNGAPTAQTRDFIDFVLSPEGNELLRQTGHAPERGNV